MVSKPTQGWSLFPHNFKSSYDEYLIHYQVKILVLIKLSYMSPSLSLIIVGNLVIMFQAQIPLSFEHFFLKCS